MGWRCLPHLVNWKLACEDKEDCLSIHRFGALSSRSLGNDVLTLAEERETSWKQVIINRFGLEEGGWCSRGVRGGYSVGVC